MNSIDHNSSGTADPFGNILLNVDSYKASHAFQYPPGTQYVYSYIESRGGKWNQTVFFGLQMFLKQYLCTPVTRDMIDAAEAFWKAHGEPFYRQGWEHIVDVHTGYLPVLIKAVPEGEIVPGHNVLVTIVNTDPECFWLTSALETALLRAVWYPTTVATNSWHCKQVIAQYLDLTSDDPAQIAFKLHDFGARGVSSLESAAIGGVAHLVNFSGTDTVSGVLAARKFYGEDMAGFSIPAAEHSTMTAWGRDHEADAYRNMIRQFGGTGKLVAVVSDSYDLFNAVDTIWGEQLRQEVIDSGATIVIRPDSGDPAVVPVECVVHLGEKFGYRVNAKGYKVLAPCVRVIQGDGINIDTIGLILRNLADKGWAVDNIAFGMGGGLLQQLNRDTLKFAMKCSAAQINGRWVDVYKDPVTDPAKHSKRGRLALICENGTYETVALETAGSRDLLEPVFRDGKLLRDWTFTEIRERANRPAGA
ncbi:nicotinate phosphoribosyltransferase [Thalassospira mesophila]|uniref:Nicotinamide phosphoribosyltransferase n=1 Tax=Thalassospira mesophila TaxID=1293891 RepID=A0A1Y2KW31_9PROT|nr:nicotinate phosphoribosyltransferase [Thalassospira mesophila]OSQ36143.1 nicotinate phosphoribosyltransferase [Thalassospira mesophila]